MKVTAKKSPVLHFWDSSFEYISIFYPGPIWNFIPYEMKVTTKKSPILHIFEILTLCTFLYFSQVRSEIIATYALCGFANLSSIGIQLGALGPMAPSRRGDLAQIVLRALLGGIVTSLMTACIAGKNLSLSISFLFLIAVLVSKSHA